MRFAYNTLGLLTTKTDPLTQVTLANGYIQKTQPVMRYHYNLAGLQTGLRDANGNLNTQRWIAGLPTAQVAQECHAEGGTVRYAYNRFGDMQYRIDEIGARTDYTFDALHRLIRIDRPAREDATRGNDRYEYDILGQRIAQTDALGARATTAYDTRGRIIGQQSAQNRITRYSYTWDASITSLGGRQSGGWVQTQTDANGMTLTDKQDVFKRTLQHIDLGGHSFNYTWNQAGYIVSVRRTPIAPQPPPRSTGAATTPRCDYWAA